MIKEIIAILIVYAITNYIAFTLSQEIRELKELRVLDSKTIEDLQERLKMHGLDDGIG